MARSSLDVGLDDETAFATNTDAGSAVSTATATVGGQRKRSEHALGHLQPPVERSSDEETGRWINELWEHLISVHLGRETPPPKWFALAASGRLAVTSRNEERAFASWNRDRSYPQRVRLWGFVSTHRPHRLERSGPWGITTLERLVPLVAGRRPMGSRKSRPRTASRIVANSSRALAPPRCP